MTDETRASVYEAERHGTFEWRQLPLAALESGPLQNALATCRMLRGDAFAPVWKPEVVLAMPLELAGMTNVIDVGAGRPPFSYRFFGSRLAAMHPFDLTNKTTDAITPSGFRNLCVDQHLITIGAGEPCLFRNKIPGIAPDVRFEHVMLRLPFSDDGRAVSHIMTLESVAGDFSDVRRAFAAGEAP